MIFGFAGGDFVSARLGLVAWRGHVWDRRQVS